MTNAMKLAVRLSEIRQRLNEIAGLEPDAMTDEVRTEADKLAGEYKAAETQHRSALIAEGEEAAAAEGEFGNGDGTPAETRALLGRVRLPDYLGAAAAGIGLSGAPAELAAALEVPTVGPSGGIAVPWRMLAGPEPEARAAPEARAFTTTGAYSGPTMQRPILQRLFGPGIMDALGVRMDTVPAGMSEWPLITAGVAPGQVVEGTAAAAAVTAVFSTATLRPKRLTGRFEFTHEVNAQVLDLEQALRRDLADAVMSAMSAMSDLILNGAAVDPTDAATSANVEGFLTWIAAPTAPSAESDYADYAGSHAGGVDGIHAAMEREVSSLLGVASYTHSASVYQSGSGESGSEALTKRGGGCMASVYVPAPTGAELIQPAIFHAAGPNGGGVMRGDSVAAMWPTLEVIRDIYSQASQGVTLTWVSLWDAYTAFRSAAYRRVSFRLA